MTTKDLAFRILSELKSILSILAQFSGGVNMLTKRQKQVLDFIRSYIQKKAYGPTLDEISNKFGMGSASAAHQHVRALKTKGYLKKQPYQTRSISLYDEKENVAEVPLVGQIALGEPIESFLEPEVLSVPKFLLCSNGKHYALQAKGNSMIDDGILDGDLILVKEQNYADNGDLVVAQLEGHRATLKRFYNHGKKIELRPKSSKGKHESFFLSLGEVEIQGKFCGLIRKGSG